MSNEICDTNRLPLGQSGFSNIRNRGKIYVDKTKIISKIAEQDTPLFLSRPRRFGKSLLINTLQSLFEKGLEDFHGLDIEKIWSDSTYKVVHIDFSRMIDNDIHSINYTLSNKIIQQFKEDNHTIQFPEKMLQYPDIILDEILQKLDDYSTVLLIDEYDAPLTHHINEKALLQDITTCLSKFYATIKQYTDKFRFIFITGITRVSHVSVFSAFNNLVDLSLDDDYNDLLGFTQNDLIRYFDPYIGNASQILNMSKNDVYLRLEQYYDGFQFSPEARETVYNPWSILSFLKLSKNGFKNYWFESGGTPSLIMQYIKKNTDFDFIDYDKRNIEIDKNKLSRKYEISDIPQYILLYQAGYYTIRRKEDGKTYLVLPNEEVEESLLLLYIEENSLFLSSDITAKMYKISKYIDEKNLFQITDIFNSILNECVSILSNIFNDERSVRDIIYAALIKIPSIQKIKERETVKGRSDLELITEKTCMIIEFKRINSRLGPEAALRKALEQLKMNRYGLLFSESHALYRVGMVISTEEKMILHDFCKEAL